MMIPNPRVYQAARAFAQGESVDKVREILLDCFDIDEDEAEKVVLSSSNFRGDIDGGYSAFINAVNLVLGTKAYHLEYTSKKQIKHLI